MKNYNNKKAYPDEALYALIAQGDCHALSEVLLNRVKKNFMRLAMKEFGGPENVSEEDMKDYYLSFLSQQLEPNRNGQWRMRNLNEGGNPSGYLYNAFKKYVIDQLKKRSIRPEGKTVSLPDTDGTEKLDNAGRLPGGMPAYDGDDDSNSMHVQDLRELQVQCMAQSIVECSAGMPDFDRYVLSNYLIFKQQQGEAAPLKIAEKIAAQFGRETGEINSIIDRVRREIRTKARALLNERMLESDN